MVAYHTQTVIKSIFIFLKNSTGLEANDGLNALHRGRNGFDKVVWQAAQLDAPDCPPQAMWVLALMRRLSSGLFITLAPAQARSGPCHHHRLPRSFIR